MSDEDLQEETIIDSLHEHVQKIAPFATLYSGILAIGVIFITLSQIYTQLFNLDNFTKSILMSSGISFSLAGFCGMIAIFIYVAYKSFKLSASKLRKITEIIMFMFLVSSFGYIVIGILLFFEFTVIISNSFGLIEVLYNPINTLTKIIFTKFILNH